MSALRLAPFSVCRRYSLSTVQWLSAICQLVCVALQILSARHLHSAVHIFWCFRQYLRHIWHTSWWAADTICISLTNASQKIASYLYLWCLIYHSLPYYQCYEPCVIYLSVVNEARVGYSTDSSIEWLCRRYLGQHCELCFDLDNLPAAPYFQQIFQGILRTIKTI